MAKKILGYVKLQIPAGKATPGQAIGPALSQKGINIMEFCKAFNAKTQSMEQGMPIPVIVTAYTDKTFSFVTKTPPVSYYIKKAAKIDCGSHKTGITAAIAKINMEQVREIAKAKLEDMNAHDIDAACQMVIGSAKSMGVEVEGE